MNEIILDTAQDLQCEQCERLLAPGAHVFVFGFNAEGENWIMPYCPECAVKAESRLRALEAI